MPRGRCEKHRFVEVQRVALDGGHRWYHTARWKALRHKIKFDEEPFCRLCGKLSHSVDHIIPHRGDERLFWDRSNLQSLCAKCHGIKTSKGQ